MTAARFTATTMPPGRATFAVAAAPFTNRLWRTGGSGGIDLHVNEIGKYRGETLIPDGTVLLEVNADGAWTVTPS